MIRRTPPTRTLREHPDLDQLKRQAKELLDAFIGGDADAVAEVNAHYRAADPAAFALHDAQLVLARAHGFDSWPKLKAFVDGVTVKRLCDAVRARDLTQARAMLRVRPELATFDLAECDERQALHFAVFARDAEMVRLLMRHGANGRKGIYPNRDATAALTIAVERGYDEIAAIIREEEQRHASEPRRPPTTKPAPDEHAMTAAAAVASGDADWLSARHAAGLLEPIGPEGGLLSIAVERNRLGMLALLLDLGLDPNERHRLEGLEEPVYSAGGPLYACAGSGKLAMAALLLARGGDPNAQVYAAGAAIWEAYRARDAEMIALLERHGGIVTALTAGYLRQTELARRMFAQEDAGVLPAGTVVERTTLAEELLAGGANGGDPEIVRLALARIDWPRDDPRWYRMLSEPLAFWHEIPWIRSDKWRLDRSTYLTCFRLILARCHPNQRGSFGRTILHDVVKMGRRNGVPPWITEDEAAGFAETLLDAGARLDVRDEFLESTPLGWACRWGRVKMVRLMLDRGADPIEADAQPWATPEAWATKMKHQDVLAVLRR